MFIKFCTALPTTEIKYIPGALVFIMRGAMFMDPRLGRSKKKKSREYLESIT